MELPFLLRPSLLRVCGLIVCLALLACGVSAVSTDVHVVKLAVDGSTVLAERTVDYRWLEANLPVRGDGSTHYYHQGPTFDAADLWDPTESKNVQDKDMGAVKGTALRDLCGLVGGMQSGDSLVVRASDGFSKRFAYGSVYSPSARQGQMVLTWYKAGEGYVPSYSTGMRIVFYADTSTNPWGLHVFGNADMKVSMPSSEWHYFNGVYPTTTGLSVQSVNELRILSTQSAAPTTTATTRPATTATATKTPAPTTQTTGGPTTKTTTLPGTTAAPGAPTTPPGATTVSTASAVTTATPTLAGTSTIPTAPSDDGGSVVVITTTGAVTAMLSPRPTLTTVATATSNLTVNGTGNVTPSATGSPVPTATGYDRTYDYSISTGLDYVTDLDEAGTATVTATPTPTVTTNATESPVVTVAATPAATDVLSHPPGSVLSPATTASPNDRATTRSLSFTFSFQVRESGTGPVVNASQAGSAAIVSPTSPLGAFWAFMKAVARLFDPFFT